MGPSHAGTANAVPAVALRGITKRYPGVTATRSVDLVIERATIHGLLGENGAGKSTLTKILFGLVRPDEGSIEVGGQPVRIGSAGDALALGIGMVQQHFSLIADFSVAENLVLGNEPTRHGRLDLDVAHARINELSDKYRFRIDPAARVGDLAVGARQRVEILKALYRGAEVLILDEPTAALAPHEIDELIGILEELRLQGRTIIFISHKLAEVIAVCDRVTVLRDGAVVGHRDIAPQERPPGPEHDVLAAELATLMVGRDLPVHSAEDSEPGEVVLELSQVSDGLRLGPVDLTLREGEIVGIAGVEGNGQTELVEVILGTRRATAGKVRLQTADGPATELTDVTGWSPRRRLSAGIGHVAEDRHAAAVATRMDLAHNASLGFHHQPPFARGRWWMSLSSMQRFARGIIRRFDVRGATETSPLASLSGGNQQKLVVGRELSREPRLFVAAQPTRGLDVGATAFVHDALAALRRRGVAVLLVSLELTEVMALADRILVMAGGRIVGETKQGEIDLATLGRWMTSGDRSDAATERCAPPAAQGQPGMT